MSQCYLYKLPNELLLQLFLPISTRELLLLTSVSRRVSTIILRILHNRMVAATQLDYHALLLECYPPSANLYEPPYFCTYRGTEGLYRHVTEAEDALSVGERLGKMRNIYSRFRPYQRKLEQGGRRVLPPPGEVSGSRIIPGTIKDEYQGETIKQTLILEAHELFTQVVAQANLAKLVPRYGLFTCFVTIEEGVIRVWKEWLAERAAEGWSEMSAKSLQATETAEGMSKGKQIVKENDGEKVNIEDPKILWVSESKNTGIRFNVKEKQFRRDIPILVRADEDMPVTYEIEYDELFIRTSHLLMIYEKSMTQEDNYYGKAMILGYFG